MRFILYLQQDSLDESSGNETEPSEPSEPSSSDEDSEEPEKERPPRTKVAIAEKSDDKFPKLKEKLEILEIRNISLSIDCEKYQQEIAKLKEQLDSRDKGKGEMKEHKIVINDLKMQLITLEKRNKEILSSIRDGTVSRSSSIKIIPSVEDKTKPF